MMRDMADVIKMKVVGVGGAGNNVVDRMKSLGLGDITFVNINTDRPNLMKSAADERVQIGEKLTKGRGAGSKPEVGRMAAEEDRNNILKIFEHTDVAFLTAGMGGGTGTGAIPVVADAAREMGVLTIAVVSTPFHWEGQRKMRTALEGIEILKDKVDTLFVIPNDNISKVADQKVSFVNAFAVSDDVLNRAVGGIADLLRSTYYINLDFADLKAILRNSGLAHLGIGEASGKGKVEEAAAAVIHSALTETSVDGARRVIVNLVVSPDLPMEDVTALMEKIYAAAHPDVNLIFGLGYDEAMTDALRVIIIATDFDRDGEARREDEETAAAVAAAVEKQRAPQPGQPGSSEEEDWDTWFQTLFGDK